jgi:hypothetical protein
MRLSWIRVSRIALALGLAATISGCSSGRQKISLDGNDASMSQSPNPPATGNPAPTGMPPVANPPATKKDAGTVSDPNQSFTGKIGKGAYWLQDTSSKVQPTTAPGTTDGEIDVEGPRDSVQAYQIVLRPTGGGLSNVNATATELTSTTGGTIPMANITLFREFFIDFASVDQKTVLGGVKPVPANSPTKDTRLPDPLIPLVDPYTGAAVGAPFGVDSETNVPLWVDIQVPKDATAGVYSGSVNITSDGQAPIVVPISLNVWDLTLPDSRTLTTYFKIDWENVNGFHAGMDTAYPDNDPRTKVLVKRYQELAHSHRIDPLQIWVPYPNGCTPPTDWSDFDAVLGPYMDGTYWDDQIPSTYFGAGIPIGDENTKCNETEYAAVAKAWASHLKDKGWFNRSWIYAADEPSSTQYPLIAQQSSWVQEGDPDWKAQIIDSTMPRTSSAPILDPALGVYVVCLKCFSNWDLVDDPSDPAAHVYGRSEWADLFKQGIGMWFYESVAQGPPYPGFATNTLDAAEPRIMMWGSWFEGASGFLYYSITELTQDDPWGPNISFPKTGDGVLVYPGNHDGTNAPAGSPSNIAIDGPVPSLRLKMVRAGLEDWALFKLAAQNGLGDMAHTEVAKAYTQMGGCTYQGCNQPPSYWTTDYATLSSARKNVAVALMQAGVH